MKELPSVTAFEINKKLNNYQEKYVCNESLRGNKDVNVISKINNIFSSNNHVYKSKVRIYTNNNVLEKIIVGKTSTSLLTIDGEKINIINIVDIEKI